MGVARSFGGLAGRDMLRRGLSGGGARCGSCGAGAGEWLPCAAHRGRAALGTVVFRGAEPSGARGATCGGCAPGGRQMDEGAGGRCGAGRTVGDEGAVVVGVGLMVGWGGAGVLGCGYCARGRRGWGLGAWVCCSGGPGREAVGWGWRPVGRCDLRGRAPRGKRWFDEEAGGGSVLRSRGTVGEEDAALVVSGWRSGVAVPLGCGEGAGGIGRGLCPVARGATCGGRAPVGCRLARGLAGAGVTHAGGGRGGGARVPGRGLAGRRAGGVKSLCPRTGRVPFCLRGGGAGVSMLLVLPRSS